MRATGGGEDRSVGFLGVLLGLVAGALLATTLGGCVPAVSGQSDRTGNLTVPVPEGGFHRPAGGLEPSGQRVLARPPGESSGKESASEDEWRRLVEEVRDLKRSVDRLHRRVEELAPDPARGKKSATAGETSPLAELPPPMPEPPLSTDELIEWMLDGIDREVARLRAAGKADEARQLAQRVMAIRNRLTDQADFAGRADRELHVVGLYEGMEHQLGRQRAEVHVTYGGAPVVLCLTSYEPIHWTVKVADDAKLLRVILGGRKQFLDKVPPAVKVDDYTSRTADREAVPYASSRGQTGSSPSGFAQLAKRLKEVTGLEIATFQGAYRYSNTPIVVGPGSPAWRKDRVLGELRPVHEEATRFERRQRWLEIRDLRFTAVHYTFPEGPPRPHFHRATATIGEFTPLGPILATHKEFPPDVDCPVFDPVGGRYYAIRGHGLVRVNTKDFKHTELEVPADFPDLSWPCGLALDTRRGKVVMVSLGGTGYMYGYEPATENWTLMADMKEAGLVPFVYLPEKDQFIGLQVEHPANNVLYRYDHQGKLLGRTPLSYQLINRGGKHRYCQAIPVGEYLVFLIGVGPTMRDDEPAVRAFVVDPETGEVLFSCLHDRASERPEVGRLREPAPAVPPMAEPEPTPEPAPQPMPDPAP